MLNKHLFLSLLMAVSTATVSAETHHAHWSYTGENDAAHWGDLSEDFAVCKTGKQQSPVDFSATKAVKGKQPAYRYNVADYKVENNGHTLQATPQGKAQTIVINGKTYTLKQFHFHTPSEHTFKGKHFPMEAHFVHQSEAGELAVLAVMFEEGKENPALAPLLAKKLQAGEKEKLAEKLDVMPLFPEGQSHFRLNGSLTTPPFTEGVNWVVFKTAVNASKAQLDAMRDMIGHANNRPVQPLNARLVIEE